MSSKTADRIRSAVLLLKGGTMKKTLIIQFILTFREFQPWCCARSQLQ